MKPIHLTLAAPVIHLALSQESQPPLSPFPPQPPFIPFPPQPVTSYYGYRLVSYRGPACPLPGGTYTERETYLDDDSLVTEIYTKFISYPSMKATMGFGTGGTGGGRSQGGEEVVEEEVYTWCETTVEYIEASDFSLHNPVEEARFIIHGNGTMIISTYELDEGVSAFWRVTYTFGGEEAVDHVAIHGPISTKGFQHELWTGLDSAYQLYADKCGTTRLTYKIELRLKADRKGARGRVQGYSYRMENGTLFNKGVMLGFSHEREKCCERKHDCNKHKGSAVDTHS